MARNMFFGSRIQTGWPNWTTRVHSFEILGDLGVKKVSKNMECLRNMWGIDFWHKKILRKYILTAAFSSITIFNIASSSSSVRWHKLLLTFRSLLRAYGSSEYLFWICICLHNLHYWCWLFILVDFLLHIFSFFIQEDWDRGNVEQGGFQVGASHGLKGQSN